MLFGTPFISGKDSLNNEFRTEDGDLISVPPTLLISAIGVIKDVRKTCTSDLKNAGNPVYVLGATHDELGGSHWYRLKGRVGRNVPQVPSEAPQWMLAVHKAINKGWVRAAHDPSEGGLAVAAAEMAFASDLGMHLDLRKVKGSTKDAQRVLFSESTTRFVVEIDKAKAKDFEAAMKKAGVPCGKVGRVTAEPRLTIVGKAPEGGRTAHTFVDVSTDKLRTSWRGALALSEEN
jgi:phosphoribosylformylglycinamidine (FGAM) synthase-like enzyme